MPGDHWSERFLEDELMTPISGSNPELISSITLALFEDLGYYKMNYRSVENYMDNYKLGCKALQDDCPNPPKCRIGDKYFVTSDFLGIGYCVKDPKGCPREIKYSNRDCRSADGWPQSLAKYGASFGNNCTVVEGEFKVMVGDTLYTQTQSTAQAECSVSNRSYILQFQNFHYNKDGKVVGDAKVTCTKPEEVEFNLHYEHPSKVKCNDPAIFCHKRFMKIGYHKCDNTCLSNGRCQKFDIKNPALDYISDSENYKRRVLIKKKNKKSKKIKKRILQAVTHSEAPMDQSQYITKTETGFQYRKREHAFGTTSSGSQWKCWCYKDLQFHTVCPDLEEDRDGSGY